MALEVLADAVLHEADLLPLDELALGVVGAALGLRGLGGDGGELVFGDGRWDGFVAGFEEGGLACARCPTLTACRTMRPCVEDGAPGRFGFVVVAVRAFRPRAGDRGRGWRRRGVGAGVEQVAQQAVDDEVREAADGRGEVGVAGAGEGEVADVLVAVAGLLERAQHEVGEDALLGMAADLRGQALVHLRGDGDGLGDLVGLGLAVGSADVAAVAAGLDAFDREAGEAERVAELAGGLLEVEDALGVGGLVDAVDAGGLGLDPVGDALVGREHELLDEAVRPAALRAHDGLHVAVGIELDDGLGEVEVDRAAALALGVELERELRTSGRRRGSARCRRS